MPNKTATDALELLLESAPVPEDFPVGSRHGGRPFEIESFIEGWDAATALLAENINYWETR